MFSRKRPQAGCTASPARTRRCSAGSDRSTSSATRDTSPTKTTARRSVSSASVRQRSKGPSKFQTSGAGSVWALSRRARSSWRSSRDQAHLPPDDLHRDLRRRIGAVVAGAVHMPALSQPVALGQHADDLGPGAALRIGAVGRDVPLVGPQRSASGMAAACLRVTAAAQPDQIVEREPVARKAGRAGLAGDPGHAATGLRIEDLLAGAFAKCPHDGCTTGHRG